MDIDARPAIRLPLGVRDFLPRAAARRRAIAEKLLALFESWGYARIITPLFECADVLERGLGADARAAAIRFVEPGTGEVVALRPDITPQVARVAATRMSDIDGPLRFCYQGAVTRMSQGARVQREVLQAGVELIGADSPDGDAEAIAVAAAALALIDIPHTRLDIGHVAPARHALGQVADPALRRDIAVLLGKKDRAGVARVSASAGLAADLREVLVALPTLWGPASQVLRRARALPWPDDVRESLELLASVLAMSRDGVEAELHSTMTVDLGEVRGFEYYTGIRFAGYAEGVGDAVLRGGRYDELIGRYGKDAHATGFAVDIEAIAQAQHSGGVALPDGGPSVLVVTTGPRRREGARLAAALRAHGWRAAVDLGQRRARPALLGYAHSVGFAMVLELTGKDAQWSATARPENTAQAEAVAQAVDHTTIEQALRGDARSLIATLTTLGALETSEAPGK